MFSDVLRHPIGSTFHGQESKKKAGKARTRFIQGRVWEVIRVSLSSVVPTDRVNVGDRREPSSYTD